MYNIGNLPQIINSLNSTLLVIRSEVDSLKQDIKTLKDVSQPSSANVDELQCQVTRIQETLDNITLSDTRIKLIEGKVDAIEKSISDKVVTLQQIVHDKDRHLQQEVQNMIDQSISLLLGGLRTSTTTHDNPAFAPLTSIEEGDEASILTYPDTIEGVNEASILTCPDIETSPVTTHQDGTQQIETPKPKGRGGRKKKVVQ